MKPDLRTNPGGSGGTPGTARETRALLLRTASSRLGAPLALLALLVTLPITARPAAGEFTATVVVPDDEPVVLVGAGETWRWRKGISAPEAGWQTLAEAALGDGWSTGPGAFGYADNDAETAGCGTLLPDMRNGYSTFYVRRTFTLGQAPAADERLWLTMDWDDGFIAWIDGQPAAYAMVDGAPQEPGYLATASGSHESSGGGGSPNAPVTFDLGLADGRLDAGSHVLAIMGLNQARNSSDFILRADLTMGRAPTVVAGTLLGLSRSSEVSLAGTSTLADGVRVTVDNQEAAFDPESGRWSHTTELPAGFNRLLVRAWDAAGVPLVATNVAVVVELASTSVGGELAGNTVWTPDLGIVHVTDTVVVPQGVQLSIAPGVVCLFSPGTNLEIEGGTLEATGSAAQRVYLLPADGASPWGGVVGQGDSAVVTLQNFELCAGYVELLDGATGTLEDGFLHDYVEHSPAIIHTRGSPQAVRLTVRRCHVQRYYEILCQLSLNCFEDCLMEDLAAGGDGIDFDGAVPGSVIRRCTVRHGRFTNIDAIDVGEYSGGQPSRGVLIADSLLYDFQDKGISMGVQVEVAVTNCFIHHVDAGLAVKDRSTATVHQSTVTASQSGIHAYNKANGAALDGGGAITEAANNIFWGNAASVLLENGSTLVAHHNNFEGLPVAGEGNVSLDPVFLDAGALDCRLAPGSPLRGHGVDGADLGAVFPVGAAMAPSHPQIERIEVTSSQVVLHFWADPERAYSLFASDQSAGGEWTHVTNVYPLPLPTRLSVPVELRADHHRYYRLGVSSYDRLVAGILGPGFR